ncbi:MAG TPA: carcinine hydrolase/isopenicillin-N N-acyltransferase family protein, partial [Acidimicrobiia bacterium]|nr:carcinine hydrolase/isopenicillin-N N-acyltransferase family protein [Acidimicrobiia bacterium]
MCDTMVTIGDAGVLFAKNSDRDPNESQRVEWHSAADHPHGERISCTWIDIDQVTHTNAVLLSRPWWMWGAEIGANEHGVVIGNEAVFTNEPYEDVGLLGMDLLRLALERASNATDAVQMLVTLLETHGQGGSCSMDRPKFTYHNSFIVADPT